MNDYTVDFIIQRHDGAFLTRRAVAKKFRYNHLNATSFNTRKDAEKTIKVLRYKDAIIVMRKCTLTDELGVNVLTPQDVGA